MNKILSNPVIIIVFSIFCLLAFASLRKNAAKTKVSSQNIAVLEKDIASLEEKIKKSQESLDAAQQPLSREKILRNELLMQKEGEYLVQLPNLEQKVKNIAETPISPWQEWKKLIF